MFSDIPWLAVIVATVAHMVLNFLWYGPIFGKPWAEAAGVNMDDAQAGAGMYAVPAIGALVTAIVLWNMMGAMGATDVMGGITTAFWAWLGFNAFTSLTNAMFRGSGTRLWSIESSAHLVSFALAGVILALMA